ncbi:MAG: peptidoglycan-associated lipoprotein Pal [Candidatus Tokpelaia sp.]|uniref:peptidoglycan-associated lipoprotein Pal n=1 Tax=Candidatus Tokpelaia sp. TaxID=2233777 RepID=UPI00123A5AEF|nr:peptidoglycan-associated lipoprotein Pal [Candidatus Tokpelaia sp.]KAA6205040.1 MAG: peptidoglycan-associated lipoprotein Pal [Candidatus Tokpelaia sp.]KAA6207107.1 MAG: peptidoglycan-associated lipoprotein Pal [Candidatus Tokpelaia sp.]KAA6405477.1 peptidoglycan-associated lipoprotein Pal [Candidatus Tokpelaia sp.]
MRLLNKTYSKLFAALCLSAALAGCGTGRNSFNNSGMGYNAKPGSVQDFTVNVGDRVFFDLDSSSIRADGQKTLQRQAQWLNRYPQYTITVEGHADERGTREYNLALGQRRAVSARNYLASQGVAMRRMKTISYGKERPVAVCDDISCWSQNRRAVTVINNAAQ